MSTQRRNSLALVVRAVGLSITFSLLSAGAASKAVLAQCVPATFPQNWLQQQEAQGGHTIARHVGRTNQQLIDRLRNSSISAASTYPNLATASTHVQAALTANATTLNNWVTGAAIGEKRAVSYAAGATVGRVAGRPAALSNIASSRNLLAVMTKTANGTCLLLTSYPTR
ncbi:RNase A-like domain-containing protein [Spirulina major]|uniref:RNase A-like domain-containing protein n=1 Tax=Spirulina major TaxID=270636 RepID=UPI000934E0D8|nr:RNase A-like domain-containing protein [Spirulina major]